MQLTADGVDLASSLAIHAVIHPLQVPLWIDLTSVVVAALAGAAVAVEERFDLVGGILLAVAMGLGGGIIRDLLLGLRPVAVTNHSYLPTVTVAALAGYLFASLLRRSERRSSSWTRWRPASSRPLCVGACTPRCLTTWSTS